MVKNGYEKTTKRIIPVTNANRWIKTATIIEKFLYFVTLSSISCFFNEFKSERYPDVDISREKYQFNSIKYIYSDLWPVTGKYLKLINGHVDVFFEIKNVRKDTWKRIWASC